MNRTRILTSIVLTFTLVTLAAHGQVRPADAPDTAMLNRIWLEGTNNSRIMEHLSWLTDVFGPRIPGSPAYNKAAAWAVQRFKDLGLANAAIEPSGELGLGWSCDYVSVHMTAPSYMPVVAYPRPWTGSTKGKIAGGPVLASISSKADMEKYKGQLKGAIVLISEPRPVHPSFDPPARRLDDKALQAEEQTPIPVKPAKPYEPASGPVKWEELEEFFKAEEVGCLVEPSTGRADYGTVHVDAYGGNGKDYVLRGQSPRIIVEAEQYNRIYRILDLKVPVTLEIEVRTTIYDKDTQGYDVTAEIPGTDKKDELVMLGGHLDSWTGGTGAVDDAAGCAVAMEALRILKAIGVKPRRTIRAAFWTGEEEGFYGSRGYVARHFGDTDKQSLAKMNFDELEKNWRNPLGDSTKLLAKPEYAKISGYFNYDNGSGRIRGVYLQENFQVRPIFEAWMKPLKDLGVTAIALQNTEGTDHLPFDYIGIPGFQFIQDPLDYFPYLHHTNQDVYDHAVPEDLIQSAVVMAYFVYQTAMREEMLPRKALAIPVEMPAKAR
jgi:carboxypeptidase Q